MKNKIEQLAKLYFDEMVAVRRHLHANPEPSFHEFETSKYICSKLDEYGIEYQSGIATNGIVGWIRGRNPEKRIIALRADMDALPIIEENNVSYCSQNQGFMHACGHDAHTASLLGTAKILQQIKNDLEGSIMLIFQPAEERLPGGARLMLDAGVFANHRPEVIIAQHVLPEMECGAIGMKSGVYMASSDELKIVVKGKGGHGAMPHQLTDTVLIASHIVVALQQIVSRNAEATIPTVLSFGRIIGNGATNVMPDEVLIEGTMRTMNEQWRDDAHIRITKLAISVAQGMGADCDVTIRKGYPVLVNNAEYTAQSIKIAAEYLGQMNVQNLEMRMTSEDFAFFAQEIPGVYYRLGVKRKNKPITYLHTSNFDIDEEALKIGAGTMAWLAYRFLND